MTLAVLEFRPIVAWPGALLDDADRAPSPFQADWPKTRALLREEAGRLDAGAVFVALALAPSDFTVAGDVKARARPAHPGVIVSIPEARGGALTLATDVFTGRYYDDVGWHANARAVALALGDLRRLDRYGIASQGQQYAGFRAIGTGTPLGTGGPAPMTLDAAARALLAAAGIAGIPPASLIDEPTVRAMVYRKAAARTHPDQAGGSTEAFQRVEAANAALSAPRPTPAA